MKSSAQLLISIVGPTAVGKTSFAIELAKAFETEIISVDSRQCYKETTIGTAKPSRSELAAVTHHFIDSHSIEEYVSAGAFEKFALKKLEILFRAKKIAIAVGGSGLYFKALWGGFDEIPPIPQTYRSRLNEEYAVSGLGVLLNELEKADPQYFEEVDRNNPQRVIRALEVIRATGNTYSSFRKAQGLDRNFQNLKIGLTMDRKDLYQRIDQRIDQMILDGLFEEVENLKAFRNHNALQTVGYSEIFDYLDGKYDKEEAVRLLKRNSRRYAKRQLTWFNRDPEIKWIGPQEIEKAIALINEQLGV